MGLVAPRRRLSAGPRALCDREGALLVFDEVISGFRASAGGAQKVFGVKPDLTCLGKIIGGGLPVGAYGGRADVMALVAPAGPVYQAGTLSGNPLAMTAGLWSLSELSRGCTDISRGWAAGWRRGWRTPRARPAWPLQVNAFGSLLTPFFTTQPVRDYQSALTADTAAYGRFFRAMLEARRLSAALAVRSVVPVGRAHAEKDVDKTIKAATKSDESGRRNVDAGLQAGFTPRLHRMSGGVSSRTRRMVPGGNVTSFPSVAAIVPPPPISTPRTAPFTPPRIPPMIAPTPDPAPIARPLP